MKKLTFLRGPRQVSLTKGVKGADIIYKKTKSLFDDFKKKLSREFKDKLFRHFTDAKIKELIKHLEKHKDTDLQKEFNKALKYLKTNNSKEFESIVHKQYFTNRKSIKNSGRISRRRSSRRSSSRRSSRGRQAKITALGGYKQNGGSLSVIAVIFIILGIYMGVNFAIRLIHDLIYGIPACPNCDRPIEDGRRFCRCGHCLLRCY